MVPDSLLDSLRAAVMAAPEDVALRAHLADLLADAGHQDESVFHAACVLRSDPKHVGAMQLIGRAANALLPPPAQPSPPAAPRRRTRSTPTHTPSSSPEAAATDDPDGTLAWLEAQLADIGLSAVDQPPTSPTPPPGPAAPLPATPAAAPAPASISPFAFTVENVEERLVDVGGMDEVKRNLEATVLTPLRNPQLSARFGRTGQGGLLLYGPPGCGKTFLARALAGEMGAGFLAVGLSDVLDMSMGRSERNLAEVFRIARANSPCVLFFDEIDAMGQQRDQLSHSGRRSVVNQLLAELDGIASDNAGVFVLAATNSPWDVDLALRRPGRLDRTLLVLPPDEQARRSILAYHLRDLPTRGVAVDPLARATEGFSGADLAYLCSLAAEIAMVDSARAGTLRPILPADLTTARRQVRPSIGPWLETARNVAQFANVDGTYDDLAEYLRGRGLL